MMTRDNNKRKRPEAVDEKEGERKQRRREIEREDDESPEERPRYETRSRYEGKREDERREERGRRGHEEETRRRPQSPEVVILERPPKGRDERGEWRVREDNSRSEKRPREETRSERRPREETRSSKVSRRGESKRKREREKKYGTESFKQQRRTPSSSKRLTPSPMLLKNCHTYFLSPIDQHGRRVELKLGIAVKSKMMRRDISSINLVIHYRAGIHCCGEIGCRREVFSKMFLILS